MYCWFSIDFHYLFSSAYARVATIQPQIYSIIICVVGLKNKKVDVFQVIKFLYRCVIDVCENHPIVKKWLIYRTPG